MNSTHTTSEKLLNLRNLTPDGRESDVVVNNEIAESLISEGGEGFYNYIEKLGLANEKDMIVLSARHHYYYDSEEMSRFNTLISLKELNEVQDIKSFLFSCLYCLPEKSNFIGCFTDNVKVNGYEIRSRTTGDKIISRNAVEHGIVSNFPFINMLYSLMDSKTYRYLSRMDIFQLLNVHRFKIIDMTEVGGLTYFHSQKISASYN